jgi:hypothetical protein
MDKKPKIAPLDSERIKDVAEAVYRDRLGERDVARMIAEDKDGGAKLRGRAQCYGPLVVPFCRALGVEVPRIPKDDG